MIRKAATFGLYRRLGCGKSPTPHDQHRVWRATGPTCRQKGPGVESADRFIAPRPTGQDRRSVWRDPMATCHARHSLSSLAVAGGSEGAFAGSSDRPKREIDCPKRCQGAAMSSIQSAPSPRIGRGKTPRCTHRSAAHCSSRRTEHGATGEAFVASVGSESDDDKKAGFFARLHRRAKAGRFACCAAAFVIVSFIQ